MPDVTPYSFVATMTRFEGANVRIDDPGLMVRITEKWLATASDN